MILRASHLVSLCTPVPSPVPLHYCQIISLFRVHTSSRFSTESKSDSSAPFSKCPTNWFLVSYQWALLSLLNAPSLLLHLVNLMQSSFMTKVEANDKNHFSSLSYVIVPHGVTPFPTYSLNYNVYI